MISLLKQFEEWKNLEPVEKKLKAAISKIFTSKIRLMILQLFRHNRHWKLNSSKQSISVSQFYGGGLISEVVECKGIIHLLRTQNFPKN